VNAARARRPFRAVATSVCIAFFVLSLGLIPAVHASGPTVPGGVLYYVPITLTNSQASAVSGGSQVLLTVDWGLYSTYLNARASNVIFFDSAGTPLNAWMQTFVSTSDVTDTVWVQLNSTGIPASSARTIYMGFYSTSTNNFSPGGNWGEAPTISGTYGQYDNGANVFTLYDNFAGTTLSSKWVLQASSGGTITVNNGITFSVASGTDYVYIHTPSPMAFPLVFESDILSATGTAPYGAPNLLVGFSEGTNLGNNLANGTPCSQPYPGYDYDMWENYVEIDYNDATNCLSNVYTGGLSFTPGVWSFTWYATGAETGTDSVHGLTWNDNRITIGSYYLYTGSLANNVGTFESQWTRARITPPNDVAPSVSFGAIKQPPSVLVAPVSIDSGQTATLTASPSGGSGGYSYAWFLGDSCSGTVLGTGVSYTTGALTSDTDYCVQVTDSLGSTATATVTVTVNPPLAVTITPSAPVIDYGQSVTLTVNPSGGSGGYAYAWYQGPTCTGTVLGASDTYDTGALTSTTAYCVEVTDSLGSATGATDTVTVNAALTVTITPPAPTVDSGQTETLTANPTGGSGGYAYQWYSDLSCTGTAVGTSDSYTTPALTSTTSYCVRVTDSLGGSATAPDTVSVNAALAVTITPSSPTIDSGQSVTLAASPSGGSGGYTYDWYQGSVCTGTVVGASSAYNSGALTSTTSYCVEVSDSLGTNAESTDTVSVNAALTVTITPPGPTIDDDQSETMTANPTGGSGGYTYQWYSGSSCTGTVLGTSASYTTPALSSTTTYCVTLTDSLGSSATATDTVTINAALLLTITPPSPIIDTGQSVSLTANPSGGSGGYSYAWYSGSSCAGTVLSASQSYDTGALASTTTYCASVTDSLGSSTQATDTVNVNPVLTVNVSPQSPTIDNDQSQTLTAVPSGGSGGYTYAWYQGITCSGTILGASDTYDSGALTSTTSYCVKVTDSLGSTATVTDAVSVNPILTVAITPSGPTIDSGQPQTLTANPSGGAGGYTYAWYQGSVCIGTVLGASSTYNTGALTSAATYCVMVTDSLGSTATATDTVTVNAALSVTITPSNPTIGSGRSQIMAANPLGGSGGYAYAWYQGLVCSGTVLGASSTYDTGALTSTTSYCVLVTDSLGSTATDTDTVTVNSVLTVTITPSSPTIDSGQSQTLTAIPSGGSGGYTYAWYSGSSCTGTVLGTSVTHDTGALTSTATYCVQVTDSLLSTATATVTVNVNTGLSVSVSPANIDSGQTATLTAVPSGGSGSYTSYAWYSGATCSGSIVGSSASYTTTALTSTSQYCVQVTDSLGATATYTVTVTVNPVLIPPTASSSVGTVDAGQPLALISTVVSTGTPPYTYQWFEEAPGASSFSPIPGATSSSYAFVVSPSTTPGTWYFELQVTDSPDPVVTSNPIPVIVDPPLAVTASASAGTVIQGTPSTLTSSVGGTGTPPYTYQWLEEAPGASSFTAIPGATSASYTFTTSISTATGTWSFDVQVTDGVSSPSSAVTAVIVNPPPIIPAFPFPFAIPIVLAVVSLIYLAMRRGLPSGKAVPVR
jgi:hypothetical protein